MLSFFFLLSHYAGISSVMTSLVKKPYLMIFSPVNLFFMIIYRI